MRKSILSAALTASVFLLSATPVHADYYQYSDELRKPGQTVEEAKKEQMDSYREAMNRKYNNDRTYNNLEKKQSEKHSNRGLTQKEYASHEERAKHAEKIREASRARLEATLGMTDEQKSSFEMLRNETHTFMAEKKSEINAFQEGQYQALRDILTDEQKEKLDALKQSHNTMKASHHEKRKLKDHKNYRVIEDSQQDGVIEDSQQEK